MGRKFLQSKSDEYYLIEIEWNKKFQKLEIFIDSDDGITLGGCQKLSREMQEILEEENFLTDSYVLDVSSPGIDRPLKLTRQYVKNIGRIVTLDLNDGSQITARLEKVVGEGVIVRSEQLGIKGRKTTYGDEKTIEWKDIKQTIVQVRF
ncbi:MAG: ribosome maturation factor RimP [Saprospiraceae bacterium]|nr:ribosome maturation factor RimP [Saprospiraceae bacterium]